ncbi:MAG: DMT family transporter [Methylobacterium sp.]
MTGAMACFAVNDLLVKLSSAAIEPMQIMAVRGVMTSALLLTLAYGRGALRPWKAALTPVLLLRTVADVGTTISYISALRHLPLANASAIFQALPLTITLAAALFLGEPVGWRRWLAIAVGFVGVLVILRPTSDGFGLYAIWVLVSVAFAALRDLATRRLPSGLPSLLVAGITSVAVSLTGFAMLPVVGWSPMTRELWIWMAVASVAIGAGYVMIVASMRTGDMGFVAPFRYTVLLFAFALGILVLGERPDWQEIVGSGIVVASGAYMIHRETRRSRPLTVPPSAR